MGDSLFDLFGDHLKHQATKHVSRQPLFNAENHGKAVLLEVPVKPNEPIKKTVEPKKSFLSNTGKALQSTPARQMFSPKVMNVNIYLEDKDIDDKDMEELEFTKPPCRNETKCDLFGCFPLSAKHVTPPPTPPNIRRYSMELITSFDNDFLDYSLDSLQEDDDLGLPAIY